MFLKLLPSLVSLHAYFFILQESRRRFDKAIHVYDQVLQISMKIFYLCEWSWNKDAN